MSGVHDVIQNLRLINALGIETDESEIPRFPLTDADRARATQILADVDLPADASFIAIHAGSGKTPYTISKRWPTDNYAELVRRLRSEFPHELLILEGPDERDIAKEIFIRAGEPAGVHVVQLKGPLGEAAALLERAALYAGSDSGLAHLAAAVGNRAVTIFAPADPDRVCPYGSRDLVVKPDKPCSPCSMYPMECTYPKVKCTPPFCISEVTLDQVMQKVRSALNLIPSQSVRG